MRFVPCNFKVNVTRLTSIVKAITFILIGVMNFRTTTLTVAIIIIIVMGMRDFYFLFIIIHFLSVMTVYVHFSTQRST